MSATGAGSTIDDMLRLVYDTSVELDTIALLDLRTLGRAQFGALCGAVLEASGGSLSPEECETFTRCEIDQVKAVLRRIRREKLDEAHADKEDEEDDTAITDMGPVGSVPFPRPDSTRRPPPDALAGAADLLHFLYETPASADRSPLARLQEWSDEQIRELAAGLVDRGQKLSDADQESLRAGDRRRVKELIEGILSQRQENDRAYTADERQRRVAGFGQLGPTEPVTRKRTLAGAATELHAMISDDAGTRGAASATDKILGKARLSVCFKGGFPAAGRSGCANTFPTGQFLSGPLLKTARALGIQTLVDMLVRSTSPIPRSVFARMLGVPTPALLLAAHRAELLDLPVNQVRGKPPHLKDIVLLSRLGLNTVRAFSQLGVLFEGNPVKAELTAAMIAGLQKGQPNLIGRGRMTRHDLREWMMAAQRRGSDIVLGETPEEGRSVVELAAERVLSWYLDRRFDDPEALWHEMIYRLVAMIRSEGQTVDIEQWKRLLDECGQERTFELIKLTERSVRERDRERRRLEMQRYIKYTVEPAEPAEPDGKKKEEETSLFTDLQPLLGPDTERPDRLICFLLDPVPGQNLMVRTEEGDPPESSKPVYIGTDPDSGVIIPFGN